jgi:PAS domain S-box-containing protein
VTLVGPAGSLTGSLRQRLSQAAGLVAVTIAAAALAGSWAGLPLLAAWGAGQAAMQPPGALCLAALGAALAWPGGGHRLAVAAGAAVAAFAAFLLTAALLDLSGSLAWLALRTPGPGGPAFRMVYAATLAFVLAGAALALSPFPRHRLAATGLAGLAAALAGFALLGALTGIDTLHGRAGAVAAPPLPSAAGLLCVAVGLLLRIGAMPALRTPRPLWQLLTALGGAIIVPLLLFGAYAEVNLADARLDEVRNDLTNGAQAVSAGIDRQMFGELERLQALAASPSLRTSDFAAFQRQAEASLAVRQNGNIMLVDRDMRQLVNTWAAYGAALEKPATAIPEPVARALATGQPQFSGLFIGQITGRPMFAIVVPVAIDGDTRYALVRSISQHTLAEPIARRNLPAGWQAAIANAGGDVLAQTVDNRASDGSGEVSPPSAAPRAPEGRRGAFTFTGADGRPSLAGYAVSDLTGWRTVAWEPMALIEAPVRALLRTLGFLALMSLGLAVALALWLGRLIARSVGHAASAAATGEARAPPPEGTPVAEVNTLIVELREAAAKRQAAEDWLRDSERELRLVTDNAPVSIARCNAEGRFTFANRLFAERYGLTSEQIIGQRIAEVIGDKAFAAIERYIAECLAGHTVEFAFEATDRAGESLFIQGRFVPEWRAGKVVGFLGATTDITRLKQAEQRLRASEVTFRQLVDHSPFGIFVVDADFRVVQASIGAHKAFDDSRPLTGRDLAEAVRASWPEPFATEAVGRFRRTLETGEPYHAPAIAERRKDTGAAEAYDWKIERLTMPDGRFGVVCHFYDLSERQRYEAALRESEATFRAMFDSSAVGKIEIEVCTGRFLRANAAMCKFVGYSERELLSRTVFDITHPADRDADRTALRSMDTGSLPVFDREKRYIRKDGEVVWARVTANTILDEAGRPMRNTAVIQDINERKQAEQDLEAGRTRLQLALDTARLGWFQYDPARRSGVGDARFKEMFDLAADDTPVGELMKHVHPDDEDKARAGLAAALSHDGPTPSVAEFRIRRRSGDVRWIELHGVARFEGAGRERHVVSLIATAQDITERKQHEEQTQLLMREVNHRAKNMLSVVDAIAHQTIAGSPEDFIARFSERIQALSANQDLLVRNEWKGVWIADLVRAQLAHFSDLVGSRIVVRGKRLRLNAASAQAIGLALHELSTNAGKYGALSNDTGGVTVAWRIEDDTFRMDWTESGGPPVTSPERRGFGTVVMETIAGRSVGGNVELDYQPSGVTWRLTCPAATVLEPVELAAAGAPA